MKVTIKVFDPALNCPRLMDDDRRCGGSVFQTVVVCLHCDELAVDPQLTDQWVCRKAVVAVQLPCHMPYFSLY